MKPMATILTAALLALLSACKTQHEVKTDSVVEVKPIKIEPIYARIDIYIKIDKELDSFFDFEESVQPKPREEPVKNNGAQPSSDAATPDAQKAGAQ